MVVIGGMWDSCPNFIHTQNRRGDEFLCSICFFHFVFSLQHPSLWDNAIYTQGRSSLLSETSLKNTPTEVCFLGDSKSTQVEKEGSEMAISVSYIDSLLPSLSHLFKEHIPVFSKFHRWMHSSYGSMHRTCISSIKTKSQHTGKVVTKSNT